MVDVQTLTTMFGGIGIGVAAIYYIFNLRETMKNRRVTMANNIQQNLLTEDWQLRFIEVLNMQWSDFEDFKRKYDSSVDTKSFAKRQTVLASYDNLGTQYLLGALDLDYFKGIAAVGIIVTWLKFKPIIEAYRSWEYPVDSFVGFEYLANALLKRYSVSDPDLMKKMNRLLSTPVKSQ